MCARYAFFSGKIIKEDFGLPAIPDLTPRYNIAPTQAVPAIIQHPDGQRELTFFQWGLVPSWAKDPSIGTKMINARAETLAEKPSFRTAYKRRRCLLPADGFFEWTGPQGAREPHFIHRADGKPMALAGLYEYWEGVDGALQTCTIVTTAASDWMARLHDRMPVILEHDDYASWLDLSTRPEALQVLLAPGSVELAEHLVPKAVGNPRFDDPSVVQPVA